MNETLDYQLFRFGQPYASWGKDPNEIIERESDFLGKPWWLLRILGWHIGERTKPNTPFVKWSADHIKKANERAQPLTKEDLK